jgi:hypothetical protein
VAREQIDPPDPDAVLTAPSWRDDSRRLDRQRLWVTALDIMVGVTPEMIDWWFGHMDRELYLAFHPVDHKEFAWRRGKQPGSYVGATHLSAQVYGGEGRLMRAEISYIPPEEMFDAAALAAASEVGVAVCAKLHLLAEDDRPHPEEAGRFTHVCLRRRYGTEVRSCWWLNNEEDADAQSQAARRGADVDAARRFRHAHEEFNHLATMLPRLYALEHAGPTVSS